MSEETSRELDFDEAYAEGTPPWDIGRPQPALVELEAEGVIAGAVLDVGCGTGENALHYAARGHRVLGVDTSENAIRRAREKATERGLDARFAVHDAFALGDLDETFDTVTDCGLFHVFEGEDAVAYARSLRSALKPGGRCVVLGFSERDGREGPSTTEGLLRRAFSAGWDVESITGTAFETTDPERYNRHALLAVARAV